MFKIVTMFIISMLSMMTVSQAYELAPSPNWRPGTVREAALASKEFSRCASKFSVMNMIITITHQEGKYDTKMITQGSQLALAASMYTLQRYYDASDQESKNISKSLYDGYNKSYVKEFLDLTDYNKANLVANNKLFVWANDCISLMNLQTSLIKEMTSN